AAAGIQGAGEDQAGFGFGLGGVDLQPPEAEIGRRQVVRLGPAAAGDAGDAVLNPPDDAAAGRAALIEKEESKKQHGGDTARHHQPTILVHGPTLACSLAASALAESSLSTALRYANEIAQR